MCVQLLCSENGETDFQWICYIIFSFMFKIRNWLLTVNIVDFNLLGIVYISQSSHYCNWPLLAMPSNLHTFFYWVLFTIYLKIIFILVCIHQLATSFKFSVFLFLSWTCFWGLCQRLEAVCNKNNPSSPTNSAVAPCIIWLQDLGWLQLSLCPRWEAWRVTMSCNVYMLIAEMQDQDRLA